MHSLAVAFNPFGVDGVIVVVIIGLLIAFRGKLRSLSPAIKRTVMIVGVCIVILVAIGMFSKNKGTNSAIPLLAEGHHYSSLNYEAKSIGDQRFSAHWTQTGNVWTSKTTSGEFIQVAGITCSLNASTTASDRLNGIEWRGILLYGHESTRSWQPVVTRWDTWGNGKSQFCAGYTVTGYKGGRWDILPNYPEYDSPNPSDIPQ